MTKSDRGAAPGGTMSVRGAERRAGSCQHSPLARSIAAGLWRITEQTQEQKCSGTPTFAQAATLEQALAASTQVPHIARGPQPSLPT